MPSSCWVMSRARRAPRSASEMQSPAAAITTALAFFVAFWLLYDGICRVFGSGRRGDLVVERGRGLPDRDENRERGVDAADRTVVLAREIPGLGERARETREEQTPGGHRRPWSTRTS